MFWNLAPGGSVSGPEFEIPISFDIGHQAISKYGNRGGGVCFCARNLAVSAVNRNSKPDFL